MPFGRWIPAKVSEYGITAAIQEYIEPARPDLKNDRVRLSVLLKETRWPVELLEHAIATYGHPKPLGRTLGEGWDVGEPFYSRQSIASWRERMTHDLGRMGFTISAKK